MNVEHAGMVIEVDPADAAKIADFLLNGATGTLSGEDRTTNYTRVELADILHVHPATVGNWAARGLGPKYSKATITSRTYYRTEDIQAWIDTLDERHPYRDRWARR